MQLDKAFFISWKPTPARKRVLRTAIDWARSKNLEPTVIAMEWENYDIDVEYVKVPFQLPPGHARNIALNWLYASNHDYVLILDDDTYIGYGDDIIESIRSWNKEQCARLDVVTTLEEESLRDTWIDNDNCHIFELTPKITSGTYIVKNVRKHARMQDELWFNPQFIHLEKEGLIFGEDVNFLFRTMYHGYCGWVARTTMCNDERHRAKLESMWHKGQDIFHPTYDLVRNASNMINKWDFQVEKSGCSMVPGTNKMNCKDIEKYRSFSLPKCTR